MSIVTLRFFIFAGFILAEYWLCPPKWRWVMLLLGSGYFLLACTELPLAVRALGLELPCVDPTEELAKAAVRFCGRSVRGE